MPIPVSVPIDASEFELVEDFDCPCCNAERAVAPFVAWLREVHQRPLEDLLLAQAVAITALEQLGATDMERAYWTRLGVRTLLDEVRERCVPEPTVGEVRRATVQLLRFLAAHGLLRRRDWQRLRRRVRVTRATATGRLG